MANVSSKSFRSIAGVKWYLLANKKKRAENREYVAISATNGAAVSTFFQQMEQSHELFGKDSQRVVHQRDTNGKFLRDDEGNLVPKLNRRGEELLEGAHVQYYSLVQGFGLDELDPEDPESWDRAQGLGQALARRVSEQTATCKVVKGEVVTKEDADTSSADGHMALVVTEIGEGGKLHNHIIIDAVNRKTGASLNSSFVSHNRLAPTHDKVLAEQGFQQREDMLLIAAEVLDRQRAGEKGITYRQAAEQTRQDPQSVADQQDLRYEQWRKETELAHADRLDDLPPEPFSISELTRRATTALADPRATSLAELQRIAEEHRLAVTKRGKEISFGMLRQQPDGSIADPSKSDIRRGPKLGDDFAIEKVEQALQRNELAGRAVVAPQPQPAPPRQRTTATAVAAPAPVPVDPMDALRGGYDRELKLMTTLMTRHVQSTHPDEDAALIDLRVQAKLEAKAKVGSLEAGLIELRTELDKVAEIKRSSQQPAVEQPTATKPPLGQRAPYSSSLRKLNAPAGPHQAAVQQRIDAMVDFDEAYSARLQTGEVPDSTFERRVTELKIDQKILANESFEFHPAVREQLDLRENALGATKQLLAGNRDATRDEASSTLDRWNRARAQIKQGEYAKAAELTQKELSPREQMLAEVDTAEREQSPGHHMPGR